MISLIKGTLEALDHTSAHVLTQAGVGYELLMPLPSLCELKVGDTVMLWTALVVREDANVLCGFLSKSERDTFLVLIKTSGVGLKMALSILSSLSPELLAAAVTAGDEGSFTRIAGVGKKTAQRLLIELNGKLGSQDGQGVQGAGVQEAELALLSLGYKQKEVDHALKSAKAGGLTTTDALIRAALKSLLVH